VLLGPIAVGRAGGLWCQVWAGDQCQSKTQDLTPRDPASHSSGDEGFKLGGWDLISALILGVIAFAIIDSELGQKGWIALGATATVLLALLGWYLYARRANHRKQIFSKYGDTNTARRILNGDVWEGMTAEELKDWLGRPVAIDDKKLKTKRKQIWKYYQEGQRSFRLRITLEDDIVSGWEHRR